MCWNSKKNIFFYRHFCQPNTQLGLNDIVHFSSLSLLPSVCMCVTRSQWLSLHSALHTQRAIQAFQCTHSCWNVSFHAFNSVFICKTSSRSCQSRCILLQVDDNMEFQHSFDGFMHLWIELMHSMRKFAHLEWIGCVYHAEFQSVLPIKWLFSYFTRNSHFQCILMIFVVVLGVMGAIVRNSAGVYHDIWCIDAVHSITSQNLMWFLMNSFADNWIYIPQWLTVMKLRVFLPEFVDFMCIQQFVIANCIVVSTTWLELIIQWLRFVQFDKFMMPSALYLFASMYRST